LECGKLRIGEARHGEPWADRTEEQISYIKGIIVTLQSVVERS
jgi:hypothetical protein